MTSRREHRLAAPAGWHYFITSAHSLPTGCARSRPRGRVPLTYRRRLFAIIVGGGILRFAWLGHAPMWRDEAFTALTVAKPFGSMLHVVAHDSSPPLAYVLQHLVAGGSGDATTLRLWSAIAGTVAIGLAAALGRRIGGDRIGLWSAGVAAVLPSMVLESRDARMYSLATTFVLAATLALWRLVDDPTRRRAAVYALCTAAAVYTSYFTLFATVAQLIAIGVVLRPPTRRLLVAIAAAAAGLSTLVPWLVYARDQFTHASTPFWVSPVSPATLAGVATGFFTGPSIDGGVPGSPALELAQGVAVVVGTVALVAFVTRRSRLAPDPARACTFLFLCAGGAIALLVAASLWHPLVDARYASVMWGPLVCLVAVGLDLVPRRVVASGVLTVAGAVAIVLGLAVTQPDTPVLAERLEGHVHGSDLVAAAPAAYLLMLRYGDDETVDQTKIISPSVPWYWGTAVFPHGAVRTGYSTAGTASPRTIYWIDVPGQPRPLLPPRRYHRIGRRTCYSTICLTVFRQ